MINTLSEIKQLQNIIMGEEYSEAIIFKAFRTADYLEDAEAEILLKALKNGHTSFESRMRLQAFVCKLQKRYTQWSQTRNI